MAADDTEITLGPGKLLGLFFLLAVVCGVFFAIGYSLGKSTARDQALNDQSGQVLAAAPIAAAASPEAADKPTAGVAVKSEGNATPAEQPATSNMTFYKAVQQSSGGTQTAGKTSEKVATDSELTAKTAAAAPAPVVASPAAPPHTSVPNHGGNVMGPGTIVVQIAAVTREDDAVALADALRKKNYNVFVVNNPVTNDKFYHVQVGPFSNMQEADAMKSKLMAEGYNTIIKH